jgi:hypothetical protein
MNEENTKLQKELDRFASLVPKEILNKLLQKASIEEVVAPGAAIVADNADIVGYLLLRLGKFFENKFGFNLNKELGDPAKVFFWLNTGLEKLKKSHPVKYKTLMLILFGLDPAGSIKVAVKGELVRAIADSFGITPPDPEKIDFSKPPQPPRKIQEQFGRMQVLAGINKRVLKNDLE